MKYELDELTLCPEINCDKGKVIMETESAVIDCPKCSGRGFIVKPFIGGVTPNKG